MVVNEIIIVCQPIILDDLGDMYGWYIMSLDGLIDKWDTRRFLMLYILLCIFLCFDDNKKTILMIFANIERYK